MSACSYAADSELCARLILGRFVDGVPRKLLAREAGYSETTVNMIVNGRAHRRVTEPLRQRLEALGLPLSTRRWTEVKRQAALAAARGRVLMRAVAWLEQHAAGPEAEAIITDARLLLGAEEAS